MSDNTHLTGKPDRDRISLHEPYEVRDWTKHFGCTEQKLRQAVAAVGPMVRDVQEWLRTH